jgi:choloylglycine hydrolase
MWLNSTRQPAPKPDRETVNELQLIQYLLDRCATVQEAVAAVRKLQVTRVYAKVHYMVCDRRGACATVEYLDGRAVLHQGKRLPYRVLTNHPYAVALRDLRGRRGFGGKRAISGGRGSLERFARAAVHERAFRRSKKDGIALAFAALKDVQQGDYTQWQIVYEPGAGRVHFRGGDEEQHTTVELGKQDFTCGTPVQVMDILGTLRPGKRALVPYSLQLNRRLVQKSFKALKVPFPAPVLEMLARYPETTRCGNAAPQTGSR